jgi:hypothetical protein
VRYVLTEHYDEETTVCGVFDSFEQAAATEPGAWSVESAQTWVLEQYEVPKWSFFQIREYVPNRRVE